MRTLLFTGKGGVGKSTLAAATAARSARDGQRTLVLSTDTAHSLADALGTPVGPQPTRVAPKLWVQHVDAQGQFEKSWADIQRYLLSVLDMAGVDSVAAEELTVIPGAEEILALLEVRQQALSGEWDVVVVDCAPTGETLRLLALPEALGWYMDRVLPVDRRLVKALRPMLNRATTLPMPEDSALEAFGRLQHELDEVRTLLTGPSASVRLVLTPESVVLAEARRCHTLLSLFGYRVDGVVVNRIFPEAGADVWRTRWVKAQQRVMAEVADSFSNVAIWRCGYRDDEPVGVTRLLAVAEEVYGAHDPVAPSDVESPLRVSRTDGGALLQLGLPLADREDVCLARKGDELVITVGSYRRLVTLPLGLTRHRVTGARVRDGSLQVRLEESTKEMT